MVKNCESFKYVWVFVISGTAVAEAVAAAERDTEVGIAAGVETESATPIAYHDQGKGV